MLQFSSISPGKFSQEKKITYSVGQLPYPVRLVEVSADALIDYLVAVRDDFSFLPGLFRQHDLPEPFPVIQFHGAEHFRKDIGKIADLWGHALAPQKKPCRRGRYLQSRRK